MSGTMVFQHVGPETAKAREPNVTFLVRIKFRSAWVAAGMRRRVVTDESGTQRSYSSETDWHDTPSRGWPSSLECREKAMRTENKRFVILTRHKLVD